MTKGGTGCWKWFLINVNEMINVCISESREKWGSERGELIVILNYLKGFHLEYRADTFHGALESKGRSRAHRERICLQKVCGRAMSWQIKSRVLSLEVVSGVNMLGAGILAYIWILVL